MMEEMLFLPSVIGGCLTGLLITALTGGLGLFLTSGLARTRHRVWTLFVSLFTLLMLVCILKFAFSATRAPLPAFQFHGHPTSYGKAESNIDIRSLTLISSPGLCAFLAAMATALFAKRQVPPPLR